MTPHIYASVPGWFDWETTYARWAKEVRPNGAIVEVGAYMGKSLSYLLVELQNAGHAEVRVHAVDNWAGPEPWVDGLQGDVLEQAFWMTVGRLPVRPTVHKMASVRAAAMFLPETVDRVWLDGSHTFEDVAADLEAWWPTVRPGGEMGGHDLGSFPGVQKAVAAWSKATGVPYKVLPSCSTGGPMTTSWLAVKE